MYICEINDITTNAQSVFEEAIDTKNKRTMLKMLEAKNMIE